MLPSEKQQLRREVQTTLSELNEALEMVRAKSSSMGISPTVLQDANGAYIYHPLLTAKASALHALIILDKE